MFRKLRADEIDARIATVKETGLSVLLYKDARVDQNILDETFGITGWQRSHQLIGDRLYCTVSIWDEQKNQWISKQDVGTESYTEKEKGQASDSFKRACFNLGIGRELYTAPFIWIPKGFFKDKHDKFSVKSIGYDEKGNINQLAIYNDTLKKVAWKMGADTAESVPSKPNKAAYPDKATMLQELKQKLTEAEKAKLTDWWNIPSLDDATEIQLATAWSKYCNG